jgi:hypothetical protein
LFAHQQPAPDVHEWPELSACAQLVHGFARRAQDDGYFVDRQKAQCWR